MNKGDSLGVLDQNMRPVPWTDLDDQHPFHIPEWRSFGESFFSPRVLSRHFLILGETGSGKTQSAVGPILKSALRYRAEEALHRAAVLLIDPKSELVDGIEQQPCIQDRPVAAFSLAGGQDRVWLFEGTKRGANEPRLVIDYTLSTCSPSYVANRQSSNDSFWHESARQILEALVGLDLFCYLQHGISVWSAYLSMLDMGDRELVADFGMTAYGPNYYANAQVLLNLAIVELRHLENFVHTCEAYSLPRRYVGVLQALVHSPDRQQGSQLSTALLFLGDLASPALNDLLDLRPPLQNGGGGKTGHLTIASFVERGGVLAFSPRRSSFVSDTVGRILKAKFFEAAFRRRARERPVFYICDEFQRFISSDPESGEQSLLDTCRAHRVACVLATQSLASLAYALDRQSGKRGVYGNSAVDVIVSNTGNKLFFRSTDVAVQERLTRLLPTEIDTSSVVPRNVPPLSALGVGECCYMLADGSSGRGRVVTNGEVGVGTYSIAPRVRLLEQLTFGTALTLCDTVDRILTSQKPRVVSIEINTPGGDCSSLLYLLSRFSEWRKQGVKIETTGLLNVFSAGAILLAFRDIGYRRAHKTSKILFHSARALSLEALCLTRIDAQNLAQWLSDNDGVLKAALLTHLFDGEGPQLTDRLLDFDNPDIRDLHLGFRGKRRLSRDLFGKIYDLITGREQLMTADQAHLLGLIDHVSD